MLSAIKFFTISLFISIFSLMAQAEGQHQCVEHFSPDVPPNIFTAGNAAIQRYKLCQSYKACEDLFGPAKEFEVEESCSGSKSHVAGI